MDSSGSRRFAGLPDFRPETLLRQASAALRGDAAALATALFALFCRDVQAMDDSPWAFALKLDFGFISVWVFSVQEVVVCWGRCDVCLTQAD